jgi:ATP-dependent Clp protease ATP-binding subunit ClpA
LTLPGRVASEAKGDDLPEPEHHLVGRVAVAGGRAHTTRFEEVSSVPRQRNFKRLVRASMRAGERYTAARARLLGQGATTSPRRGGSRGMSSHERFTESAKKVLVWAQEEAIFARQRYIGTEHLALALCRDEGAAGRILADLGITSESLTAQVSGTLDRKTAPDQTAMQVMPSSRVKRVIEVAFQEATGAGADLVGTEHFLLALLVDAEGVAARALEELHVTLPQVRHVIGVGLQDRLAQQAYTDAAGTSSSLGIALARAEDLAKDEGVHEIRADHLIRAMAESGLSDLQGTLRKLGPTPQKVADELTVPDEIRQLGQAVQRARVEHAAAFTAGGPEAVRAVEDLNRTSREYSEAVSRWLAGGQAR